MIRLLELKSKPKLLSATLTENMYEKKRDKAYYLPSFRHCWHEFYFSYNDKGTVYLLQEDSCLITTDKAVTLHHSTDCFWLMQATLKHCIFEGVHSEHQGTH